MAFVRVMCVSTHQTVFNSMVISRCGGTSILTAIRELKSVDPDSWQFGIAANVACRHAGWFERCLDASYQVK